MLIIVLPFIAFVIVKIILIISVQCQRTTIFLTTGRFYWSIQFTVENQNLSLFLLLSPHRITMVDRMKWLPPRRWPITFDAIAHLCRQYFKRNSDRRWRVRAAISRATPSIHSIAYRCNCHKWLSSQCSWVCSMPRSIRVKWNLAWAFRPVHP